MIAKIEIQIKWLCAAGLVFMMLFMVFPAPAQHVGDDFLYQGIVDFNNVSARAEALGQAYSAVSGDLDAMFFNPAGLVGLDKLQLSISASTKSYLWREYQEWNPGSGYRNVSLILDGLWKPDPALNGIWSDVLFFPEYDSLGNTITPVWDLNQIQEPDYGHDPYSKERAEFDNTKNNFGLEHVSAGIPFNLGKVPVVAAVSYYRQHDVKDIDWNGTHLDPPWQTSDIIIAEPDDTTRTNWSQYNRSRSGDIYSIRAALGIQLFSWLNIGAGFTRFSSETEDLISLDRVGYFLTIHQSTEWAFSYDNYRVEKTGISKFSSMKADLGAIFSFDHFSFGGRIFLPSTVERSWNYTTEEPGSVTSSSGADKVKLPLSYNFGISFKPYERMMLSFDFKQNPLSRTEYELDEAHTDTLNQYTRWVDQNGFGVGASFELFDGLWLQGGYHNLRTPWIAYGAAFRDRGTEGETYSAGFSLYALLGRLDLTYSIYYLKYYDAFMSNINYAQERVNRVMLTYTVML